MICRTVAIRRRTRPLGFTLIESVAVIVLLSIMAAVISGPVLASGRAYADSAERITASERASTALDRIVRILRGAAPTADEPGDPDIASAAADFFELGDGTRVELLGTALMLTDADGRDGPLATNVTAFDLAFFDAAGQPIDPADASSAQLAHITLAVGTVEFRTAVFLRANLGDAS